MDGSAEFQRCGSRNGALKLMKFEGTPVIKSP
jgi:hypothetical protein